MTAQKRLVVLLSLYLKGLRLGVRKVVLIGYSRSTSTQAGRLHRLRTPAHSAGLNCKGSKWSEMRLYPPKGEQPPSSAASHPFWRGQGPELDRYEARRS